MTFGHFKVELGIFLSSSDVRLEKKVVCKGSSGAVSVGAERHITSADLKPSPSSSSPGRTGHVNLRLPRSWHLTR